MRAFDVQHTHTELCSSTLKPKLHDQHDAAAVASAARPSLHVMWSPINMSSHMHFRFLHQSSGTNQWCQSLFQAGMHAANKSQRRRYRCLIAYRRPVDGGASGRRFSRNGSNFGSSSSGGGLQGAFLRRYWALWRAAIPGPVTAGEIRCSCLSALSSCKCICLLGVSFL